MKAAAIVIIVVVVIATSRCIRGNPKRKHGSKESEETKSCHGHLTVQLDVGAELVNRAIENSQEILRAYRT